MTSGRLAALILVAAVVVLSAAPADAAPIAHREVLPNGLVLLVAERPGVPIVAVRVFMRAGGVFDPADRAGLANLTGALLARGTAKHTGPEIDAAIEFVGGSLEAGAGRDGLTASLSVLKKDLGLGFDLLSEVVLAPTFPEDELKRKVAQIQAAIKRSDEDPNTVAARALARLIYPNHPYGRPVEGTIESVGKLTRDAVVAFHRGHVRPDTTIVAVVGDVTVDEARRLVEARLGGWARPAGPAPVMQEATGAAAPATEAIPRTLSQATILLGRQAIRQVDPDYFPLAVASYVLGGGSASRLYARVRDEGGLAYVVYSYVSPGRYAASFVVSAQTRVGEVPKVTDMLREELARLGREPATDDELRLAKEYLIGSFPLRLDTTAKVADFVVAIEEQGLGLDYADRYKAAVARVTAADVQRVAARFFPPDTFSRVVVGAPQVIPALVVAAVLLVPGGGALAASFTLDDKAQQAAIRAGERSTTTETFDREWRVSSNGESVTVLTPFHRLVVAARHAAFKNETIKPDEVSRVLKKDPGRLVVAVQLRGKSEDFARRYRPLLVVGAREIKPTFVQNEHTAIRQDDGVYVARCLYTFPNRELTERERLVLRVADAEGRELSRFTIDLASMR